MSPLSRSRDWPAGVGPVLDVRGVPPRLRHATVLRAFEGLAPGGVFVLVNDRDPEPLYSRFQAERPGSFGWRYLEQGPETWRVEIGKTSAPIVGDPGGSA